MGGIRATIYARFSCDKQRDASIEDQLFECEKYAEKKGYRVVSNYCDYAMSGRSDDRPQFLRMIEDAKAGLFDVILLWKIDRFARNMSDQYYYEHILNKAGVTIESCRERITGNGVEAAANKAITALFAQVRSLQSAEDTMRGMLGKARRCEYLGYSLYGYSHEGDQITLDPVRAPIAAEIHQRYLRGELVQDIVRWLNDKGVTGLKGKPVGKGFVYGVLENPRYAGTYIWGKEKDEHGNIILDDFGDPIPLVYIEDGIPALVTKEEKAEIIRRLGYRKKPAGRESYVLSGKLHCSKCGHSMHGIVVYNSQGKPYHYYACKSRNKCCLGTCSRDALESILASEIRELFADEKLCRMIAHRYIEWQGVQEDEAAKKAIQAERREHVRKREHLMNAVADGMPWGDAKPRVDALDLQIKALDRQEDELRNRSGDYSLEEIMAFFADLADNATASDEELLDVFLSGVWLYADKAVATMSFSGKGSSRYEVELALDQQFAGGEPVRPSSLWCPSDDSGRTKGRRIILLESGFGLVVTNKKLLRAS